MEKRSQFEILCVTMNQTDFSKIREMNIHSDVVFANQADETSYCENTYDGTHTAKMITTNTRGVGKNRNIALTYANAEYCLFADDDVQYQDGMEESVLSEFIQHPDADIIIFYLNSDDPQRKQKSFSKTRRIHWWDKLSFGGCRIAFRMDSIRKANIWFTTLFGGGCIFPSGEDSMWLLDARKANLRLYASSKTIGTVSFAKSSWFTGFDEKMYYGKGAYYAANHPKLIWLWFIYFALRTMKVSKLKFRKRVEWMKKGSEGYRKMKQYDKNDTQ